MTAGVLPAVDKQLLHIETSLHWFLVGLADDDDRPVMRQFATWHQLPRLRARAEQRPLTSSACRFAVEQVRHGHRFLLWLRSRQTGLGDVTQTDIDTWHASHPNHEKQAVRAFLVWAMDHGHLPALELPRVQARPGEPLTQHRRLALLRRVLDDDSAPGRARVAACLVLLYAQPVSRIVRLTIDDITSRDGDVFIRLGDPPTPVPEPFATLLLQLLDNREAPPDCRWLFPGHRAGSGQPLTASTLAQAIRDLGVPTLTARTAALRQLVLQAPAPVVAAALGFHPVTAHRHRADAGGTWNRYAPGDHTRPGPDRADH